MAWWSRDKEGVQTDAPEKKSVPKGIWHKCETCQEILFGPDLDAAFRVCPKCDHHFALPTRDRIALVCDAGAFVEHDGAVESTDPLGFRIDKKAYKDRIRAAKKSSGAPSAYLAGTARVG